MKNVLIYCRQVHSIKNPTYNVSYRNAQLLAKELYADILMYDTDKIKKEYDVILFTYFNRYTDYTTLKQLFKNNQKRFLIRSEYENISAKAIKPYIDICNFEGGANFLNTNLLISKPANQIKPKKYDCIYYSRYRADRMEYCTKYLQGNIYLSTHPKNHKHFFHAGCRPKLIKHIDWSDGKETLNLFRYSLYLEDKYTHKVFNNLANRWYESGFCNNVVFFDVNCWNTINKSEIGYFKEQIKDYIVTDYESLQKKIDYCNEDFERHLAIQKGWRLNEQLLRSQMIEKLKEIIYS